VISTHSNCICILVLTTMKMTTWVAVTGMWLLCNKITFIYPRSFVGFWNKIINWQYAVCNWQYAVCNWQYAVRNWQYAVRNWQYAAWNWQYAMRNWQYAVRNWQYAVRNWLYAVRNWQYSVWNWQYSVCNWQYAVCNWQYSVCNSVSFWRLLSSSDTKFAEKTGALALLVYNVWASFACVNDPLLRLMWLLPLLFSPHVPVIQLIAIRSLV